MSPRKLTEDDKQEILQLYRNSEATTSTLADRYEVSSSTISRFLKNKLSSTEYEELIQQKRLARTPRGEKSSAKKETKEKKGKKKKETSSKVKRSRKKPESKPKSDPAETTEIAETVVLEADIAQAEPVESAVAETEPESKPLPKRRRRRRSSASDELEAMETETTEDTEVIESENIEEKNEDIEEKKPTKLIIDKKIKETPNTSDLEKTSKSNSLILKNERSEIEEEEDDDDDVDLITLKEMLGEDLEDFNDDDDDDDDDDDWEDEGKEAVTYSKKDSNFSDVEILPLSQATFPRTCYLVIDRSAELIVKPLAEFGDLGEIPQDEIRQRTLPVFDNHRIAKRFSHRRERVIKVPDGRVIQKTSHYLQDKGITRLLIDGQIYSLSS